MQSYLLDLLICPACGGPLTWSIAERDGEQIQEAEARCSQCDCSYPVREGIGAFLTPDLQRNDLWEQAESGLGRYLREHPDVESRLLDAPLSELNPADRFFRGYVQEERGFVAKAEEAFEAASPGLYTPETHDCQERLMSALLQEVASAQGPIVDIASGRATLVERMVRTLKRKVVATDFSVSVLRRDKRRFAFLGLEEGVSFLAVDARRTPFPPRSLAALSSFIGLPNIENIDSALRELRRVALGPFYAITPFYPPDDEANAAAMRETGSSLAYKDDTLRLMQEAGWEVTLRKTCEARAVPTPTGEVIEGARIDALPVRETVLEWAMIVAEPVHEMH